MRHSDVTTYTDTMCGCVWGKEVNRSITFYYFLTNEYPLAVVVYSVDPILNGKCKFLCSRAAQLNAHNHKFDRRNFGTQSRACCENSFAITKQKKTEELLLASAKIQILQNSMSAIFPGHSDDALNRKCNSK